MFKKYKKKESNVLLFLSGIKVLKEKVSVNIPTDILIEEFFLSRVLCACRV